MEMSFAAVGLCYDADENARFRLNRRGDGGPNERPSNTKREDSGVGLGETFAGNQIYEQLDPDELISPMELDGPSADPIREFIENNLTGTPSSRCLKRKTDWKGNLDDENQQTGSTGEVEKSAQAKKRAKVKKEIARPAKEQRVPTGR
jgi:hypothetical protein